MDHELERLWPAAEPPEGFAERVVERLLADRPAQVPPQPARRRPSRWSLVIGAFAVLASLAVLVALWSLRARDHGEFFAAEAREVAIGARATALLSAGAHLKWSGARVQQDRGVVEYRVQPGGPFVVETPFGSVQVVGTVFEVRVGAAREEELMTTKKWAVGATGATLGALLFVLVHEGKVQLSQGDRQLLLSRAEAGMIGSDGVPSRVEPGPPASGSSGATPAARSRTTRELSPAQRQLRERVLGSLREHETRAVAPTPRAGTTDSRDGTMADKTGVMGEEIKIINHELLPMVGQCFDEALQRKPGLHGMLALGVKLAGVEGVGSVFESVEPMAQNEVADDEMIDCVRQSAFSIDLPPPRADRRDGLQLTIPLGTDPPAADAGTH